MMRQGVTFRVSIALVVGILGALLAACSQESSPPPYAGVPTWIPLPETDGPPCALNPLVPFHNLRTTCGEMIYDNITAPEAIPHLMGMTFDDRGTLYFTKTADREIWMIREVDRGAVPPAPVQIAGDFDLPTALAWHDDALYVLTRNGVLRLDNVATPQQTKTALIASWEANALWWPGSIGIGPDERLYVSLGTNCLTCEAPDTGTGMLLSYALDGSDRRIEATGLRLPLDFAWQPTTGELWLVDSAPVALHAPRHTSPDELNRMSESTVNFGFPQCVTDPNSDACQDAEPPALTLPAQSNPAGIAFYPYDGFLPWQNALLVVERGSWNTPEPVGYAVIGVTFDQAGQPTGDTAVLSPFSRFSRYVHYSVSWFSLNGFGFFPYHPYDVVVSANGWVYVSIEEGRIVRFRPTPTETTSS